MTKKAEARKRFATRSNHALQYNFLINQVILDTGFSRKDVTKVVQSFLSHLKRQTSYQDVYIRGFGLFSSYINKRRYFDINTRRAGKDVFTVKPHVMFEASKLFLKLVHDIRKDEIEEMKSCED